MGSTISLRSRYLAVARGDIPADLVVRNCKLVNVLSGEIYPTTMAVCDDIVVGFGDYDGHTVLDGQGRYLCPGLIDGHIHIESTLLSPHALAMAVARRGTCAVVCDPHEIANVMGRKGMEFILNNSANLPMTVYVMVPSCVPATDLETSGARLDAHDVADLIAEQGERVLGLAEVMNFPGVIHGDPEILAKIDAASGKIIDGHAPGVTGKALQAYVLAGPTSDHECVDPEEAVEKLRSGMHIFIRQGSAEHNLKALLPMITPENTRHLSFVCDDLTPSDLQEFGHIDHLIRLAISQGLNPLWAIQMATINTAQYFGLRRRGALAPGYRADFFLVDDLNTFRPTHIHLSGQPLESIVSLLCKPSEFSSLPRASWPQPQKNDLEIPMRSGKLRVIALDPGQIVTREVHMQPQSDGTHAVAAPDHDVAKLAVIERHRNTGNIGLGFVQGLGLASGAIAGTVAHDSHNLIVAGVDDTDMLIAVDALGKTGGGLVVVSEGQVLSLVDLPIAGLMSRDCLDDVVLKYRSLIESYYTLCHAAEPQAMRPFMQLSFLALPVIPALKLTDKGLVDVTAFRFVSLWLDD
ncbi:adenine deaminase [Desulfovibrio inopinatus]|uniref:adenine deaminase n=1 Tax=Desulfovibrio inopinatus TaxID=102109 RepID=UPI00040F1635|nr:adenine deaminase [Desulfovibrio inopinatus]